MDVELRPLGRSGLRVTPVALGCWPIAGITSVGVTPEASRETVAAALDAGVNHFDTAHAYGYAGESERIVGEVLSASREDVVIASKAGLVWGDRRGMPVDAGVTVPVKRPQVKDGRPETIRRQCEESLRRLNTDRIDLYYLHAPDPKVPLAETAGAFRELRDAGKVRAVGVSNFTKEQQYADFAAACPISVDQQPYNMLQRDIEADRIPWARRHGEPDVLVTTYWPLMKGLLAGKIGRDHRFEPGDSRPGYPVFQEPEWSKTHDFLDRLRPVAERLNLTVAQLVIAWTSRRPGVGSVLCGAKRPDQIRETAASMTVDLPEPALRLIDDAIARRGPVGG